MMVEIHFLYNSFDSAIAACNKVAEVEWWWPYHELYVTPNAEVFFVMGYVSDRENQEQFGNLLAFSRKREDGFWGNWVAEVTITVTITLGKREKVIENENL